MRRGFTAGHVQRTTRPTRSFGRSFTNKSYIHATGPLAATCTLYNRISHLPFWTPFMGGSLLIFLPALWCLSTAVVSMSSPAGSTTAAEVKAKTIVPRTHRQQDLILAHRIVRQMSR